MDSETYQQGDRRPPHQVGITSLMSHSLGVIPITLC